MLDVDADVTEPILAGEPLLTRCPLCGAIIEREWGEVGPHFEVAAIRPLRVTPRCQPDARLSWTGVVLADALLAAPRSPGPLP